MMFTRSSALAVLFTFFGTIIPADAIVSISLQGSADRILCIAAGDSGGGAPVAVENNTTGASASGATLNQEDFTAAVDFGDLSRGDGSPVTATVGLRMRSNCKFKLVMSRQTFTATNLQFRGRDVSGSTDGGSFITVSADPSVYPTGGDANPDGCLVSNFLTSAGLPLSQLTEGGATTSSTVVATGNKISLRGSKLSPGNAVDIRLRFHCPTGTVIGPVTPGAGKFSGSIQLAAFPEI
jgi:hypothetical protein